MDQASPQFHSLKLLNMPCHGIPPSADSRLSGHSGLLNDYE